MSAEGVALEMLSKFGLLDGGRKNAEDIQRAWVYLLKKRGFTGIQRVLHTSHNPRVVSAYNPDGEELYGEFSLEDDPHVEAAAEEFMPTFVEMTRGGTV